MSTDRAPRPYPAAALLRGAAVAAGVAGLAATVALNVAQTTWVTPTFHADPADSFVHGGLGNELAPLVVFEALPDLFPDEFRPVEAYLKRTTGKSAPAGDWVEQYG